MFTTYFSYGQLLGLLFVIVFHIISIYYFSFGRNIKYAIWFLFVGSFAMRFLLSGFDPYFHPWDEQYHALVSKNMAENNFLPLLYKIAPLPYDPNNWTGNQVWLHKQPMFMWQIALNIKMFGSSVMAVRLPSIIMSSLLVFVIFRLGKIMVNEMVGYISALLYAACCYFLEFNTGTHCTDHNDIAFMFYIILSIWAYAEYRLLNKSNYIWLIGLFAGCAILNKWTVGLLVFSGWGVSLFFIPGIKGKWNELKNILKSFFMCLCVCLPWQIYILCTYPLESMHEYTYSSKHFSEVVEGHTGDYLYYFDQAIIQYGTFVAYLLPVAIIILCIDIKNLPFRVSYITWIVFAFLFFTMAQTKMPAFCIIVAPLLFISLGNLVYKVAGYVRKIKISRAGSNSLEFAGLVIICLISMDFETMQAYHTPWIKDDSRAFVRETKIRITELGKSLAGKYDPEKAVFFNCKPTDNIPFMFFSGYTAYDKVPTADECDDLKEKGFKVFFIDNYEGIPDHIKNDSSVVCIPNCKEERKVNILASNGKYLCSNPVLYHVLIANRDSCELWEKFFLVLFDDNKCAIRTFDGNFLCPEIGTAKEQVAANRITMGIWEIFTMEDLGDGCVAFKTFDEKYIGLDKRTDQLFATATIIGESEKFRITIAKRPRLNP